MTRIPDTLMEDYPFTILVLSESGDEILWVNQAAEEWLSQSKRRLIGQSPWALLDAGEETKSILQKCQDTESPITMRDCLIKRENAAEEEIVHITAFPTDGGVGLSFASAGPQPRESRVGGQLVSGMGRMIAHELKNPLAGIKGAAQLLRDDVSTEEGKSLLDLISSEIDRIRRLADRMETLGDRDPDNRDLVNIHELLRQARRIIQSANPNMVFTERYDPSLPHAFGDADTLMQALLNLIKNASEAIEDQGEAGEVILQTRFRSGVSNRGSSDKQTLPIEIRIIDNGAGVDAAMKGQIFQPFVTSKPEGQGLGLALVSKVAMAHGGLVEVKSRPGQTVFSLLLPAPPLDNSQKR